MLLGIYRIIKQQVVRVVLKIAMLAIKMESVWNVVYPKIIEFLRINLLGVYLLQDTTNKS